MSTGTMACLIFITWLVVMYVIAFVIDLVKDYIEAETIRRYHRARYEQIIEEIRKGTY